MDSDMDNLISSAVELVPSKLKEIDARTHAQAQIEGFPHEQMERMQEESRRWEEQFQESSPVQTERLERMEKEAREVGSGGKSGANLFDSFGPVLDTVVKAITSKVLK